MSLCASDSHGASVDDEPGESEAEANGDAQGNAMAASGKRKGKSYNKGRRGKAKGRHDNVMVV